MAGDGEPSDQRDRSVRVLWLGGSIVILLGAGWFALSHLVMGTSTGDAIGEALGVTLALLVVASIIGATTSTKQDGPDAADRDATDQ